ncbi:unnamed protein product [Miscanthus lutarioriparius]|uniref:CS domain-containing protein n=1 Tax=Miscanthus lutarioriparius TaxID=422564 RepID=A0A811M5K6_9POAL|nr:unnamed protein product [Miscanthus lutarioriparius]
MEVDKEEGNVRQPNAGNGLDLEKYSWTQQLPEVNISIPVPQGTKSRFVVFDIKKNHLKGELYKPVKVDDCFWSIGNCSSAAAELVVCIRALFFHPKPLIDRSTVA